MQAIIKNNDHNDLNVSKDHNSNRHWWINILSITTIIILMIINCHNSYANTNYRNIKLTNIDQQNTDQAINNNATTVLEKSKPIERELKGGDVHNYTITMEANQYLNVVVEQKGIDVVVAVFDPKDQKIYEVDSPNGTAGPEPVYLITESKGSYKVEVRSLENTATPSNYQINIVELRTAVDKDKPRVAGYKAFGEAVLLDNAGNPQLFDQIVAKYDTAISFFGDADAPLDQVSSLIRLANLYQINLDYKKAEPLYLRTLAITEKLLEPEHPDIALILNNLALLYKNTGNYTKAEPLYLRSLAIREKVLGPQHPDLALTINNLADLYQAKGDYTKAEPLYLRALAIGEKVLGPQHFDVARTLNNLALLYKIKGDYIKAEPLSQRALAIFEKILGPNHPNIASTLGNLAQLYQDKGDYIKAEPLLQRALTITEKAFGPDHLTVAIAINNLALLYQAKADYAKAEPLFQKALIIFEKSLGSDHPDLAKAINNLATLYQAKGDYGKAESLFQKALAIREKTLGSEHIDVAVSLNNLANLYKDKQEYSKALPLLQRSLNIFEKALGPEHASVATALNNLARLYEKTEDYTKAEPLYLRALAISEKVLGTEHEDVASSLNNLALLYREKQEYDKALPLLQQAVAIYEKALGPEHPNVAVTLNNLAGLYRDKGDIEQTLKCKTRAEEIREKDLTQNLISGSEKEKLIYLNQTAAELDDIVSVHLSAATKDPKASRLALTSILRRKGRALDAMTDNIAILRRRANTEDQVLLDQLASVRAQYAKLSLKGAGKDDITQHQADLKTLEDQIESLEKEVSNRSAEFKTQSKPITLDAVQQAIPDDAVLIEFINYQQSDKKSKFGKRHYAAYLLTNTGEPLFTELGDAELIDQAIIRLRDVLPNRKSSITKEVKPAARALDKLVMQPVRKLLGDKKRLLISPDGALNLVPFDALVDEHNKYLVQQFEISYLTSGRDLLRLKNGIKANQPALVMADPDFAQGPGPKFGEEAFEPLKRLEATADEANLIKLELDKPNVLLQAQATKNALIATNRPTILHIATHGFFLGNESANLTEAQRIAVRHKIEEGNNAGISLQNPLLRSGLFFANANAQGEDATLTALEATGLDLWGTKLVVLSACNTGVGEVKSGDGVYGLRRALVLAGSESQMMSLWPVSDRGTKDLMVAYYEALNHKEGRSAGLRKVRLSFLHKPERAHPYYWASFIQSGEWANLDGQR